MNFDFDYFKEELLRFRGMMCDRKFSVEQLDKVFKGLLYVYFRVEANLDEEEIMKNWIVATTIEFDRRKQFLILGE